MTDSQRGIISIPIEILQQCPEETIRNLMNIVNKGYDQQVVKYNIVQTPRIHSVSTFFSDLGFEKPQCYLYLMVQNMDDNTAGIIPTGTVGSYPLYEVSHPADFRFDEENILSTLGYRPLPQEKYPDSFEVTGFTSVGRGCGLQTFDSTLSHFKDRHTDCKKLIVKVIVEHELVTYYEKKLGFVEFDRILQKKDELKGTGFEDTFVASQDFHVSSMERVL